MSKISFETRLIHASQEPDASTGALSMPIYQTANFAHEALGKNKGFSYSRTSNPTRTVLENVLAGLESGKYGLAFASGVAASMAVFGLLKHGDHVVAGTDIYGGTYRILEQIVKRWGVEVTYADAGNIRAFEKALRPNTRLAWIETPTNPLLKIADIRALAKPLRRRKVLLAVDNTFSSPYWQRPLELGADIVVHSTTKYIGGHSDLIGGAVVVNDEAVFKELKFYQSAAGAIPGVWDAWLALRGLKTLSCRLKVQETNAKYLAAFLSKHPRVETVYYPGLKTHPGHAVAARQMHGFGAMVSVELQGGLAGVEKFLSRLRLFILAESLGGVESLVCYPARMSHASLPEAEKKQRGIRPGLVRLSVGVEDKLDLKRDLQQALKY
jgi:cystathionine gamma-synthase/cystathionine gamma-lyase